MTSPIYKANVLSAVLSMGLGLGGFKPSQKRCEKCMRWISCDTRTCPHCLSIRYPNDKEAVQAVKDADRILEQLKLQEPKHRKKKSKHTRKARKLWRNRK